LQPTFKQPSPLTPLEPSLAIPANVDLPLDVGIPAEYVPDKNMRLRLYRRIADLRSLSEVEALSEEFADRFGPPPEPARNLLFQLKVKLLAEKADLSAVILESDQLALKFRRESPPANLPELGQGVRLGKTAIWLSYKTNADWLTTLLETLEQLGAANAPQSKSS
jgi:transcription-repair coupling factor (superfamily II helicase)